MNKYQQKHIVTLTQQEKKLLQLTARRGTERVTVVKRARALLKSAAGAIDTDIAREVELTFRTIQNIRKRFKQGGLESALHDLPRTGQPKKLSDEEDAFVIATACSNPPQGYDHWTLELLQKKLRKEKKKTISKVAIWNRMKAHGLKPWREKNVVHSGGNDGVCETDGRGA